MMLLLTCRHSKQLSGPACKAERWTFLRSCHASTLHARAQPAQLHAAQAAVRLCFLSVQAVPLYIGQDNLMEVDWARCEQEIILAVVQVRESLICKYLNPCKFLPQARTQP